VAGRCGPEAIVANRAVGSQVSPPGAGARYSAGRPFLPLEIPPPAASQRDTRPYFRMHQIAFSPSR